MVKAAKLHMIRNSSIKNIYFSKYNRLLHKKSLWPKTVQNLGLNNIARIYA